MAGALLYHFFEMTSVENITHGRPATNDLRFTEEGKILHVTGLRELSATSSGGFRDRLQTELRLRHQVVELDLSEIRFIDSQGLGVLIGLQNRLAQRQGSLKVVNPAPHARKIFELTRMGRVFEIANGN
jgi:anti-sigma B factor antagonist